ncbi:MAG: RNA polymerase factor sigma-54 [Candidatus Hydrogenedentes bacterium]|nr:RNA polymerase factor sigma-54 [Candidatus Hydrogenedentota bacterium]
MHMEHRLVQTQRQQLVLTQKMQQALHILQLNGIELEQYVQQELETNPFLEQKQKKEEEAPRTEAPTPAIDDPFDQPFDLDQHSDNWDIRFREGQDLSHNTDLYARRKFYEDSITQGQSLRAHLLSQLALSTENEKDYLIGERIIIGDIDSRGYFTGDETAIAEELRVSESDVERVLHKIQRFEPTGVGAHDVVECLLLQIQAEYPDHAQLIDLVSNHLDDLKNRQVPKIAKAMKISPDDVENLKKQLATLNPWPGHEFSSEPPQYIAAEVVVEKVEGEYIVRLADERLSDLNINTEYSDAVKRSGLNKDDKDYVRSKLEAAKWLQRNIAQRQQTILKVSQAIVNYQKDFLDKGIEHIRPLTLQVIADEIGVHESTVARTTRGKYMQTPQGLFELKYFFNSGVSSDTGDAQASKAVQARIQKIIDEENPYKPLSDQRIADILKKEGTNIARRTVTKYREALNIPATTKRKQFK